MPAGQITISVLDSAGNAQAIRVWSDTGLLAGNLSFIQTTSELPRTPAAAGNTTVTAGGTAVIAVSGPIGGGYITNGATLAAQGNIAAAENLYVDPVGAPGSTDLLANGTTTALQPGQTYQLPALAPGVNVKVNAATSGHKFSAVVWP
jgi:hypothetical protein